MRWLTALVAILWIGVGAAVVRAQVAKPATTVKTAGTLSAAKAIRIAHLVREVPHSRWLARCSAFPATAVDDIARVSAHRAGAREWLLAKRVGQRLAVGTLTAYRVGTYQGVGVYAVRGPTVLREQMAADPACSHAIPWPQVRDLPKAALTAIAPGLVCCGASSAGPAWRCDRSKALGGDVTVSRLDGYGPGVVGAQGPCADYAGEVTP